jgi:glucose/arabinose dehydrogenase
MPKNKEVDFVAIDEIQMCADRERGHVFTERLLEFRGRKQTMFLGSQVMAKLINELVNNVEFENPVKCFDPSLEPGGIIFYSGDKLSLENYMILASQKASNLYKVELDENGMNLDGSILSGVGRIRDVAQGPDGYLYVITSNTDGKGFPSNDDDKLLRIMK